METLNFDMNALRTMVTGFLPGAAVRRMIPTDFYRPLSTHD
jgi:hypothetical protein